MIESIPLVLTGIGIIVSILYYTNVLRNANNARRKDILFEKINIIDQEFYNTWLKLFQQEWSTYKEWIEYRTEYPDTYGSTMYIITTLNSIGLLLKQNIVDEVTLFDAFSPTMVIWTWDKTSPLVMAWRSIINLENSFYDGFELLSDRARKLYPDMRSGDSYREAEADYIQVSLSELDKLRKLAGGIFQRPN